MNHDGPLLTNKLCQEILNGGGGDIERVKLALMWFSKRDAAREIMRDEMREREKEDMMDAVKYLYISAAKNGHLHIIQWLLKENFIGVNTRNFLGQTALRTAIWNGNLDIAKWLVNVAGADVKELDHNGRTLLIEAAGQKNLDIVRWLVADGRSNLSHVDTQGETALLFAAARGCYHTVLYLLTEAGESVSDALWMKLQPRYPQFYYEDPHTESPRRPSSLLRMMLLSSHPVPEVVALDQNAREFFVRTCANAAKLRIRRPTWLAEQCVMIAESLVWLPSSLVPLMSAYAAPSIDEVWSLVSVKTARPKKRQEQQVLRRNPERVARKRRI